MTIPVNNRFFQRGLEGYTVRGRHSSKPTVTYTYLDQSEDKEKLFAPIRGGNICVLGDPKYNLIRGTPVGGPNDLVNTRQFKIHKDEDDPEPTTKGVSGSILECRDVNVAANSALWFIWAFLPQESHASNVFNSFAIFTAYNKDDLNADGSFDNVVPADTQILGESKKLTDAMRSEISWRAMSWEPADDFSGTLCWVVSSGKFGNAGQDPWPATLLIDTIDINRK